MSIRTTYFDNYLRTQSTNWWKDDANLRAIISRFAGDGAEAIGETLSRLAPAIAGEFRALSDEGGRRENAPRLEPFDAYNRRVDRIILPEATQKLFQEIYLDYPFRPDIAPFEYYGLLYLLAQNGEAGVMCSLSCTDGMVRLLRKFANTETLRTMLSRLEVGEGDRFFHAAQFVTEIQGGSDAATNDLEARPNPDGSYRLYGDKWFCSNTTADYFAVTARPVGAPEGGKGVALFAVPAYLDGESLRNGYRINRLKNKFGTVALPTAELTFDGAIAYPVGPLDKGLANVVGIVLTTSRLHAALNSAGMLRRVARDARHYAEFREAFGSKLANFPLLKKELADLDEAADHLITGTFDILARQIAIETGKLPEADRRKKAHALRILIMMNKVAVTREASERIHKAISIYAGNGIEEEWSPIPRLFRDAVINEVWEGPHSLLTTRALSDLKAGPLSAGEFVAEALGPKASPDISRALTDILASTKEDEQLLAFSSWMVDFMRCFGRHSA